MEAASFRTTLDDERHVSRSSVKSSYGGTMGSDYTNQGWGLDVSPRQQHDALVQFGALQVVQIPESTSSRP